MERWVIDILHAQGDIPGEFSIVRQTETARADKDRIIVTATVGDRERAGSRPWNVAVEIEQCTVSLDEATAELYVAATEDALESPEGVASIAAFTDLCALPAESEEKEAEGNTRRRVRTYNFLALEALLTSLDFNNAAVNFNDASHNFSEAA